MIPVTWLGTKSAILIWIKCPKAQPKLTCRLQQSELHKSTFESWSFWKHFGWSPPQWSQIDAKHHNFYTNSEKSILPPVAMKKSHKVIFSWSLQKNPNPQYWSKSWHEYLKTWINKTKLMTYSWSVFLPCKTRSQKSRGSSFPLPVRSL